MSYLRTEKIENGDDYTPLTYYKCDITGEDICEKDGWYGNNSIHISENGVEKLIEQYVKNNASLFSIPYFFTAMLNKFCKLRKYNHHIPLKVKKEILLKYAHVCVNCGSDEKLQFDHKHPVSKGGTGDVKNIQILCMKCNIKKSNKTGNWNKLQN